MHRVIVDRLSEDYKIVTKAGPGTLRGSQSGWDDVKAAFDFWATRLRDRLRAEWDGG